MKSTLRIWQYFKPMQKQLLVSIILGSITLVSSTALMATSGWLISTAALMPPVLTLTVAVVGVRTFALARGVSRYAERLVSHNATFSSLTGIHRAVFDRLEQLAPAGLPAFRRGDLLARLVVDVDTVQDLPLRVVLPVTSGIIAATFAVGLSAAILPTAGIILFLTLLFAATVIPLLARWGAAKSERATSSIRGEFVDELIEFYSGNADIISLGQHGAAVDRLIQLDHELTNVARKQSYSLGLSSGLLVVAQGVAIIASTWAGIAAYQSGQIQGVMIAVLAMIPMAAFESVSNFPAAALALARVQGSSERITEILDKEIPVIEPAQKNSITSSKIELNEVSTAWPGINESAISQISFVIPENTSLGLVGPSGSGKSTLISLLVKFLPVTSGKYELGEIDSAELSGDQIRNRLVLSSPDQHIFATSIAENLKIAAKNPETLTEQQMWNALEKVDLANWARALPNQLATVIGERGSTMSGGQKQRLMLARLYVADPQVWILDEPTEHLDSKLADSVLSNILAATADRSLIIASHRPADTEKLDQIYRLSSPQK
jgi:thiol reductant ABC exporter CydC subunit